MVKGFHKKYNFKDQRPQDLNGAFRIDLMGPSPWPHVDSRIDNRHGGLFKEFSKFCKGTRTIQTDFANVKELGTLEMASDMVPQRKI